MSISALVQGRLEALGHEEKYNASNKSPQLQKQYEF